jgi:hypothetical protein
MARYVVSSHEMLMIGANWNPANRSENDAGESQSACLARWWRCFIALQGQWQKGDQAACPESWLTVHDTGLYVGESE